jgi:hypothetical protein
MKKIKIGLMSLLLFAMLSFVIRPSFGNNESPPVNKDVKKVNEVAQVSAERQPMLVMNSYCCYLAIKK